MHCRYNTGICQCISIQQAAATAVSPNLVPVRHRKGPNPNHNPGGPLRWRAARTNLLARARMAVAFAII